MIKVLFLIHDLGQGGAEKVLVNLVNNMNKELFSITVIALYGGGVNEQFLAPHVRFKPCFRHMPPANSHLMKLLTPQQLHRWLIKEQYDIEISYLEGPSARIISGCPDNTTKLVCWIHSTFHSLQEATKSFRSSAESLSCYKNFHNIICVSSGIQCGFQNVFPQITTTSVLYNTVESDLILQEANLPVSKDLFDSCEFKIISVGTLKKVKGFDRLIRIHKQLRDAGYPIHTYILGKGPEYGRLLQQVAECREDNNVTFLGYETNPYKFVAKCDLFVCSSYSEGFSTSATEALIVGTPVCTVDVSGMKEMLGENSEYGIVTENSQEALYQGIQKLLDNPALLLHYKEKAKERGKTFCTRETVKAVEDMLTRL